MIWGGVLGMGVFVVGMGWLVGVGFGDGWIWEYCDNEAIGMEYVVGCNGWAEIAEIDSSVGNLLFF